MRVGEGAHKRIDSRLAQAQLTQLAGGLGAYFRIGVLQRPNELLRIGAGGHGAAGCQYDPDQQ